MNTTKTFRSHRAARGRARIGATVLSAALFACSWLALAPVANAAETKTTIKEGLKEAGWTVLPEFLDAATENITIKFPKAMGGGKLTFGGTIDAEALREKKFVFDTADGKGVTWNNAFGLPFLDLTDVGINLEASKGAFAIALDGFLGGPFKKGGKPREVILNLAIEDKKLTDFTLSLPKTALSLHDIPGIKEIPGSRTFKVSDPTISLDAIGGKVKFKGETVDAVVFHDDAKKAWNMGLKLEKALTIGELVGHNKGFLKHVGLPKMRLLMSHKGFKGSYADLPLAVQQFFEAGGEDLPSGDLELADGVNVIALFDPSIMPKDVKTALKTIGLGSTLEIDGTVEGLFGGTKAVELGVKIDPPQGHGFKLFKTHAKAEAKFFIRLNTHEQMLGFETTVELEQGKNKDPLLFDVAFALDERTTGMEVLVVGDMRGDWVNAAGIKGFTLANPYISVGINQNAGFDLLLDGTVKIGKEVARVTSDIVILPEALFLPEAIAFAGTLNKLPMSDMAAHALKHAKVNVKGLKNLKAEFRDLDFAFMTPGAKLPADLEEKLEIQGAGMAMHASLYLHGKELGKAGGHVSTDGIAIGGEIAPFKVGPLKLKKAVLNIEAATDGSAPSFDMEGDIALFKGFEDAYVLSLAPDKFEFYSDTRFGSAFEAKVNASSSKGLNFSPGNDFSFEAELDAKYSEIFKKLTKKALNELKREGREITKAEDKVKKVERQVAGLKKKIDEEKKHAKAAHDKAARDINGARKKVDSLKRQIDEHKKKIHDKHRAAKKDAKKLKLGKAAKEEAEAAKLGTELAGLETAKKTADWALKVAEKAVKAAPSTSPKVIALQTELGTAEAALKAAEGTLKGAEAINKGVQKAVKAITDAKNFNINSIGVKGSLLGITSLGKQGTKPKLILDVTLKGKRHVYNEDFITEVEKSFEHIAKDVAKQVAKSLLDLFKKA